ncbi:MAG: CAP domain-containing protein [Planctomycetota bacterium]
MRTGSQKVLLALLVVYGSLGCSGGRRDAAGISNGTVVTAAPPPPPPAPPAPPPTNTTTTTASDAVTAALALINQSRAEQGQAPVTLDEVLTACALRHAQDQAACADNDVSKAGSCAHASFINGDTCGARSENQGYAPNVTTANQSAAFEAIHQGMMSEGPPPAGSFNHFSNIVDPQATKVGLGLYIAPNGTFWVTELFQ